MAHKKKNLIDPKTLGLPLCGCDSHAHIVSDKLWEQRDDILERAKEAGVAYIGEIFLGHIQYRTKKDYFADKPQVFFIYGLHPTDLLEIADNELELLREDFINDQNGEKRIKAVGEIGLDYYWKEVPQDLQKEYFRKLLQMAKEFQLPVVIHSRDAFDDTVEILLEEGFHNYPLLWHCFDRDEKSANIILSHGWHISVPGSVTFKPNEYLREAVKVIDIDKLLVETDSPYLTPEPWRGQTNESALTVFTAKCIAEQKNMEVAELWKKCGENALRFFNVEK